MCGQKPTRYFPVLCMTATTCLMTNGFYNVVKRTDSDIQKKSTRGPDKVGSMFRNPNSDRLV